MQLSIFFLFSILVVNTSFCGNNPKIKPTTTTSTFSPLIKVGCAYLIKRGPANEGIINLNNQDLIDTTSKFFQAQGFEVSDFARHHVIPWNRISKFFNLVFLHDKAIQLNVCSVLYIIMNNLMSRAFKDNEFDEIVIPIERDNLINRLIQTTNPSRLEDIILNAHDPSATVKEVHRFFTWYPGNIFIGPNGEKRGDDPKEEFEEFAKYVVGNDHFTILNNINTQMDEYIKNYLKLIQKDRYKIVNRVIDLFKKLLPYSVTPFNPKNWRYDQQKEKWFIKHEYLEHYQTYSENIPVPDALATPRSDLRRLNSNGACMDDIYNSILLEVSKNCISSDASCGCQFSK